MEFGTTDLNNKLIAAYREKPGTLFTERTDVLPQDLVKSRSRENHV